MNRPTTLGALRSSGYKVLSVKDELSNNLTEVTHMVMLILPARSRCFVSAKAGEARLSL